MSKYNSHLLHFSPRRKHKRYPTRAVFGQSYAADQYTTLLPDSPSLSSSRTVLLPYYFIPVVALLLCLISRPPCISSVSSRWVTTLPCTYWLTVVVLPCPPPPLPPAIFVMPYAAAPA